MKKVKCPTCSKLITWNIHNTYRPFCSARCKMIDFGNWANENYLVSDASDLNKAAPISDLENYLVNLTEFAE